MPEMKIVDGELVPLSDHDIAEREADKLLERTSLLENSRRVRNAQARKALIIAGKYDKVQDIVKTMSLIAQVEWEYEEFIERYNQFVLEAQPLLEMTDEQMDDLFILASQQ